MATSGYRDEYVTKWDTLRLSWSRTGYSIANNESYISWSLQLISSSYGAINSSAARAWSVNINGNAYSGTTSVNIGNNTTKTLASGSTTIPHNNDGTKTFAYSFSQSFQITFSGSWIGTVSGSSTGPLDSIPRYATITYATDFNDEENPTINFNNPGNFDLKLKIEAGGDTGLIIRDKVTKTGPYTFALTEAERNKLRQKCAGTSLSVRFTVATYLDGTESNWSYIDKTMTLINYMPTLNPTVVDQGSVSTTLTGDPNKIILNYNHTKVTFNATALKEASISSMKVTCGNATIYSDGMMYYVSSGTFVFTVTDSRGYSASKTITRTTIDYTPLTCNLSADSELNEDNTANVNITISGTYFQGSFGAVTNSLTVEYRYKINDGEYPDAWTTKTATISNGKYTLTDTITGLDYTDSCTIQARAKDAIYSGGVNAYDKVVRVVPIFDWSKNDFNFNVPVHSTGGFTYDIPVLVSGNCNEILQSGVYYIGTSGTNKPANGLNGWLTVKMYSTDYCHQQYVTYQGVEYQRLMSAGTWGAWRGVKPHIITTTVNITANIDAGAATIAYGGSTPTETGFTATRIGGYCNGEVLMVLPNGWIHNQHSITKKPTSVTWLWLMLPS